MDKFDAFTNKDVDAQPPKYTASRQKGIAGLLEKSVFKVVTPEEIPSNTQVFNSRFVDEIRNSGTNKAYEKSRLIVQVCNDKDKNLVLTQSTIIQRVSQRLVVCLAAILQDNDNGNVKLYLRDIMLKVMKPLYGVPEVGNHWFATYHTLHKEKLSMTESIYDFCFYRSNPLGIVRMQTNDTLILADDVFASNEEEVIKGITSTKLSPKEQYVAQRARGAYIASMCQPEASFDLSCATETVEFLPDNIAPLNKRLRWQIINKSQKLYYIKLDRDTL